jgi:hypothetical protein
VTATLETHGRAYEIKEGSETSLTDLRSRSAVLVGALNNLWTLRLVGPLRYRFVGGQKPHIEDTQNPANLDWTVDFNKPFTAVSSDYAVIARYRDATTNGNVLMVAGIGPYGTEAAGEFVASPRFLDQLVSRAPRGWEKKNLEIVIKTEVIAGEAGPPSIVAATFW